MITKTKQDHDRPDVNNNLSHSQELRIQQINKCPQYFKSVSARHTWRCENTFTRNTVSNANKQVKNANGIEARCSKETSGIPYY